MAWTSIGNSLIQFAAEWTTTILTYIRDNLNWLYDNHSPVLYTLNFGQWENKPDGGAATTYYRSQAGAPYLIYDQGSASPGETVIFQDEYIYIPPGVSNVRIKAKLRAEGENANIGLTFHIGTASTLKTSIATTVGGTLYDIDVDVTGLEDSVQEIQIETYNNNTGGLRFLIVFTAIYTAYAA